MRGTLRALALDTPFARLDFRAKLLLLGVVTVVAFLWDSPIANGGLLLALLLLCRLAGVRGGYLGLIFKVMLPFSLLVLLAHGFWNVEPVRVLSGRAALTPIFTIPSWIRVVGGGKLSLEGLLFGINVAEKSLALVLVVPLAMFTTEVDQMVVSLARLRVPYKLTFIFSATLRFFPMLLDEIQTIIEAQRLRGLALERMGLVRRVRVYARVAVPLILGAMVKAQQLEVVLHAKAFTGRSDRTYLHEARLRPADWAAMAACLALLGLAIFAYLRWGMGRFAWLLF